MKAINFSKEFKSIDPIKLIKESENDEVDNFFLVLGIFYNDFKNLVFYLIKTGNEFEDVVSDEISARNGEYGGIKIHLERLIAATIHEFFEFIEKNKEIINKEGFKIVYENLDNPLRNCWDDLMSIAFKDKLKRQTELLKILLLIRNTVAFHYDQSLKVLNRGFIEYFFNDPKKPANEKAYYSIGKSMSETRFYYCDAAAGRSMNNFMKSKKIEYDEYAGNIKDIIEKINFAIMGLLKVYLDQRSIKNN